MTLLCEVRGFVKVSLWSITVVKVGRGVTYISLTNYIPPPHLQEGQPIHTADLRSKHFSVRPGVR